jgi:hypothetical protein
VEAVSVVDASVVEDSAAADVAASAAVVSAAAATDVAADAAVESDEPHPTNNVADMATAADTASNFFIFIHFLLGIVSALHNRNALYY